MHFEVHRTAWCLLVAYIDPGSGYVMLQMLGGALLGGWFYFRRAIREFVARLRSRTIEAKPTPTESSSDESR